MTTSFSFLLDPAVRHGRVEQTVDELWRGQERAGYGLCLGLRRLFKDQVHRGRGRARFVDWVEQRFGIPPKLAALFSWLGGRIERLPLTRRALASGELTYTKLREYATLATPENEERWIEFAANHTNREIEDFVRNRKKADGTDTVKVVSELNAGERQAARKAREILKKMTGESVRPGQLLGALSTAVATGGLPGAAGTKKTGTTKAGAYVSFQPCPVCLDCFVPVPEGLLRVPTSEWLEAIRDGAEVIDLTGHFFCDCGGEKHRKDRCPNWKLPDLPPPNGRYIPVDVLKILEGRDGFVCRNPACGCEAPLEHSHLTRFCEGTPAREEFLRLHCATCNDLIESGALRVTGYAPYERYYTADGEFLGHGYARRNSHMGTGGEAPPTAGRGPPGEEGGGPTGT